MLPNIIVIVSDTMRASDVGCYGSDVVQTPCLDAFATHSVRFTRAYPESLPTIPVRRALHTGRRVYPFRNYRPVRWDIVSLPGWQPIGNDEDTLAENLAAAGYHTGLVTDTLPYFAPGFNFTRGFWQWEFIRGQQQDRWQSPHAVPDERLSRYGDPVSMKQNLHGLVPMHLANTAHVQSEEDTTTARTFQWGMQFLKDNRHGQPFYLIVDCFDPHEPWEAPENYYRMYGDVSYSGRRIVHCGYGPADQFGYTDEEIAHVRAHYRGLTTMVDTWFGKFIKTLDELGLTENTVVFFMSDHGTNFCDNPRRVIGKPADSMYPGVMSIPFMVRLPHRLMAGTVCDELLYNIDLTCTIYDLAGITSYDGLDGRSLRTLLHRTGGWNPRGYVTCRYGHSVCYIDRETWALGDVNGVPQAVFDLAFDPDCRENILERDGNHRWQRAWERLLHDADGKFPDYREMKQTDAIGQRPMR